MKSRKFGTSSFREHSKNNRIEILNLSPRGMWLLVDLKEYFLDYQRYPWFRQATVEQLMKVEQTGMASGVYWPELDIDVELDALEHPDRYPLVANIELPKASGRQLRVNKKKTSKIA